MFLDLFSRSSGDGTQRSSKPEVRNPLLSLPSAARAVDMPAEARQWLCAMLQDIRREAQQKAAKSWATHKAPQALYWKFVAVYAGHLAKVLRLAGEVASAKNGFLP
jgi:hypothetical protein